MFAFFIAFAASTTFAITRDQLESGFKAYEQILIEQVFDREGTQIHVPFARAKRSSPKGTVLISTGRTESRLSWHEYALRFIDEGYAVAIVEHRGQGLSSRALPDREINHIARFEDYVSDFDFVVMRLSNSLPQPFYVLASSMGAPIAILSSKARERTKAFVLNAPMFQLKPKNIPTWFAKALSWLFVQLGRQAQYAPFTGPFNPDTDFSTNLYARSEPRFELVMSKLRERPAFRVGGPSVQWIREALGTPERIAPLLGRDNPGGLQVPTLLLQAGQEHFVDNDQQNFFCRNINNCTLKRFEDARHVFHMELDPVFDEAVQLAVDFFSENSL